jgi:hypothetical protein
MRPRVNVDGRRPLVNLSGEIMALFAVKFARNLSARRTEFEAIRQVLSTVCRRQRMRPNPDKPIPFALAPKRGNLPAGAGRLMVRCSSRRQEKMKRPTSAVRARRAGINRFCKFLSLSLNIC